ncbi:MAG: efflux RND transporter periplasmic adaptor subunit [Victivallales bacterium]|nr:efflux RND transporter periplasmic adaptor subunit [Victivallales bacterium]
MTNLLIKKMLQLLSCGVFLGAGMRCVATEHQPRGQETLNPIRPVKLFTVPPLQDRNYRYYPAKVKSAQRVQLAFQVGGQIIRFPAQAGLQVKKGQLLGTLDARDYSSNYKSAVARYNEAQADFKRYSGLVNKQAVSQSAYEEKHRAYQVAEADMEIKRKALADTQLLAPFNGVIAVTYVDNYQNVEAKQEVLFLQGSDYLELYISVPEKDIITIPTTSSRRKITAAIQPVAIFTTLKNKTFPLTLKEFETKADASTQTFKAVFLMTPPKGYSIMPGMTALVRVVDSSATGTPSGYWLPVTAVTDNGRAEPCVWVVDRQMTVHRRNVTTDGMKTDRIMVTGGIATGEIVVAAGTEFLTEGMKVKKLTHIGDHKLDDDNRGVEP